MARPKKQIDVEQLEKCAEKQWTTEEIAAFFRVSRDTIERRYAANIKAAKARGCAKLVDLAWQRALNGSDRILEHLLNRFKGPIPNKVEFDAEALIEFNRQALAAAAKNSK